MSHEQIRQETMSHEQIGKRIRSLREGSGMTREELAMKTGISTKFLYEIEQGKKGLSADNLLKLAGALGHSCDYLMTGKMSDKEKEDKIMSVLKNMDAGQVEKIRKIILLIGQINAPQDEA